MWQVAPEPGTHLPLGAIWSERWDGRGLACTEAAPGRNGEGAPGERNVLRGCPRDPEGRRSWPALSDRGVSPRRVASAGLGFRVTAHLLGAGSSARPLRGYQRDAGSGHTILPRSAPAAPAPRGGPPVPDALTNSVLLHVCSCFPGRYRPHAERRCVSALVSPSAR